MLRLLDDRAKLATLGAGLTLAASEGGTGSGVEERAGGEGAGGVIAEEIAREGVASLPAPLEETTALALVSCIDRLVAAGLPPLLVYLFDETWRLGEALRGQLGRALGRPYVLLADAWAFHVAPGPGHRGWTAHRGSTVLSRERGAPDLLNVWVALTDATRDNGCMMAVPLDDDPGYPSSLATSSGDAGRGRARALPVPARTALAWNANVLHWGGESTAAAKAARVSVTFTLRREDLPTSARDTPAIDLPRLGHDARLSLLASQVEIYGGMDPGLSPAVRHWATLTRALGKAARFPRDGGGRKAP